MDAYLIEGKPYNRLSPKIYEKCGKPVSKPTKTNSVSVGPGPVSLTHRFFRPHPPVGQKMALVNFKNKITTSANYTDVISTGYMSHDKDLKLLQNQSIKLDLY